ncbi:MAG: hypothetical protein NDI81_14235 [Desulfobacula sp.]|nr:hypothetical protein [Desulfobacula sp.]
MSNLYIWIPLAIAVLSLIALFKREEAQRLSDAASSVFSLVVSSIWLPVWAFIQWIVGVVISTFNLGELDAQFLSIFRWLFAIVTLIYVLIEIYVNIRQAIIRAQRRIEEEYNKVNSADAKNRTAD